MLARLGNSLGLDAAAVKRGLSLALSAWLAFALATWLKIPFAYWAAMPVWVVAQPRRGVMLERGVFRIIGTALGAWVGFGLVHLPVSPYVQLALLAVWMAVMTGLNHVLRGVQGYWALLAGITASVVVVPSVLHGDVSYVTAVARVECTLLGVLVVTLVTGLITPPESLPLFFQRVRGLCADAVSLAARLLRDEGDLGEAERKLLAELSALDNSARLATAGSIEGYRRIAQVDALVAASLAVVSGALVLRGRVRQGRWAADPELLKRLDLLSTRLREEAPSEPRRHDLTVTADGVDPTVRRFATDVGLLLAAEEALFAPSDVAGRSVHERGPRLAPHREWSLAIRSGVTTALVAFVSTSVAYSFARPEMEIVMFGVCVYAMVLGSRPEPQLIAPRLWTGIALGACAALGYRLWLQPHVSTLPELLLSVAPFFLLGGLARTAQRTSLIAIDFNMAFLLGSAAVLPTVVNPVGAWMGTLGQLTAATVVVGSFMLVPRRSGRQALEAAQALRRDVRRLIQRTWRPTDVDWRAQTARQLLRLELHLGRAQALGTRMPNGSLAVLGVGHSIADVQEAANAASPSVARVLGEAEEILKDAVDRPEETAVALRGLAERAGDPSVSLLLMDLAWALEEAAGVLRFGVEPAARASR